jgi:long-chain acyl-CoA synthetase
LLLHRLQVQARRHPDRAALVVGEQSVDHQTLWARIVDAGTQLQPLIQEGDRVVIALDSGVDMVVALYGTWWAKGVAVCLNMALHADDLLALAHHSGAKVAWVAPATDKPSALVQGLQGQGAQTLNPAPVPVPAIASPGAPVQAPVLDTQADALILYTSGTTGAPKGVRLSHGNLAANTQAIQAVLPIQADDVAMSVLPLYYAYGQSVLHTHLSAGATLVLEPSLMYPHRVLERLGGLACSALYGVPSSFLLMIERGGLLQASLPSLRYMAQAGAAMPRQGIERLREAQPQIGFWVMYGQTEATSRLTILSPAEAARHPGSVGRPLPGVHLSIRDELGQALPAGVVGEVCAQGPNVMQGYLNATEDSAQALRDGWLHTGDLGRLDTDGHLYLEGRSRDIIKVGAHRVSPADIEHTVMAVDGVESCVALSMPDPLLGEVVRVCVIPRDRAADTAALQRAIQQHCRASLALYKCPKQIDFIAQFPTTASGKVQKHLL